jgi:hypothetical protein
MNRRALTLIAIVLILATAGSVFFALTRQGSGREVDTLTQLPAGFTTAAHYGESSVVLSNGRSLVSYDYLAGKSAALSPEDPANGLANIDSLSASDDGRYILFHQEVPVHGGQLAAILQQRQLADTSDYWWLYDTAQHTFMPLMPQTLIAKFSGGSLTLLRTGETGETLTTYSLPAVNQIASINIPGSTDFWKYDNGFLLQRANEDLAYTEDGVVTQTFYKATTLIGIVSGSDKALGMTGPSENRQPVILDLKAHSSRPLSDSAGGQALMDPRGYAFYYTSEKNATGVKNKYFTYDFTTDKTESWKLTGDAESKGNDDTPATSLLLGNTGVIGDTATSSPYAFGTGFATLNLPPSGYSKDISVQGKTYTLTFDGSTRSLNVTAPSTSAAAALPALEAQAKSDGFDPNLYPVQYQPLDTD